MKRIVTPEQLAAGWVMMRDCASSTHQYTGAVELPDGNYEVDDPLELLRAFPPKVPVTYKVAGYVPTSFAPREELAADDPVVVGG